MTLSGTYTAKSSRKQMNTHYIIFIEQNFISYINVQDYFVTKELSRLQQYK